MVLQYLSMVRMFCSFGCSVFFRRWQNLSALLYRSFCFIRFYFSSTNLYYLAFFILIAATWSWKKKKKKEKRAIFRRHTMRRPIEFTHTTKTTYSHPKNGGRSTKLCWDFCFVLLFINWLFFYSFAHGGNGLRCHHEFRLCVCFFAQCFVNKYKWQMISPQRFRFAWKQWEDGSSDYCASVHEVLDVTLIVYSGLFSQGIPSADRKVELKYHLVNASVATPFEPSRPNWSVCKFIFGCVGVGRTQMNCADELDRIRSTRSAVANVI